MSFPCPQGIVNVPLEVCKKMQKVHGHVLETRDACEAEAVGKSAQIALASA